MKIIQPNVEFIPMPTDKASLLKHIERCGRVCYKSEDKITEGSAEQFIAGIIKRGHEAVLEHGAIILKVAHYDWLITQEIIQSLEADYDFQSFLNFTRDCDRPIVSGNIRAWRDFLHIHLIVYHKTPSFLNSTILKYPELFPEFQDSANCFVVGTSREPVELQIKDLITENEKLHHQYQTLLFTCDRGVSHELVRHRPSSFCQESTRYVSSSKRSLSIDSEDDVVYAYTQSGLSMKKIADRSNGLYKEWDVYEILRENDVQSRGHGSRGTVNENYFEQIDTPEKAFLLGFIMADGSMRRDLSQLTIAQKEDEAWWVLNMIRDFIQPDANSLTISNKKICQDLFEKGIVPNKTYDFGAKHAETMWASVPDTFKYDFLRGLLDGDGTTRWFMQTATSKTRSFFMQFTGNQYLMEKVARFIKDDLGYNCEAKKDSKSETLYRVTISGHDTGVALCERLYRNFVFPYGHSKTARYFESENRVIPVSYSKPEVYAFNVVMPVAPRGSSIWCWGRAMAESETAYKNMINLGHTPQEARSVLPSSLKTELMMTANLSEWRHVTKLRCAPAAHPQARQVMKIGLGMLESHITDTFDDLWEEYGDE